MPTSKTATSTGRSANQVSAAAVRISNQLSLLTPLEQRLEAGQAGEHLGQIGIGDGHPIDGDPLVDRLQVGAGEGAHPEPLGAEQGCQAARGGRLAVGSGDVDGRRGVLADGPGCRPATGWPPRSGARRRVSASMRSMFWWRSSQANVSPRPRPRLELALRMQPGGTGAGPGSHPRCGAPGWARHVRAPPNGRSCTGRCRSGSAGRT